MGLRDGEGAEGPLVSLPAGEIKDLGFLHRRLRGC